jgi:hypothetical protein
MRLETTDATFSPANPLTALLLAGDQGCARGSAAILSEAAVLLARCVDTPAQLELEAVARTAPSDVASACRRWFAATAPLRLALATTTRDAA